jgi:hypothetical protein
MRLRFWKRASEPLPARPEVYVGRLVCDGEGHLCAQDGPFAGDPVYFDRATGSFLWAGDGASHNRRHHRQFVVVNGTTEADPHHFMVAQPDAHEDGLVFTPDDDAAVETGHTEAWKQ